MIDSEKKSLSETIRSDLANVLSELSANETSETKKEEEDALRGKEEEQKEEGEKEIEENKIEEESEEDEKESTSDGAGDEPLEDDKKEDEEEEKSEKPWEPGSLEPNSGWDNETKESFKQLPENMQEFLLKRYNEMQSDYTKKTKDVAEVKRALDPVREELEQNNLTDGAAIRNLVSTHIMLKENPSLGIQYLMTAYGLSLDELQGNWQDSESFNDTLKNKSRLSKVETELDTRKKEENRRNYEAALKEIEEFKKDHPHYDKVEEEMKSLARSDLVSGKPKPTLESLYNRALWLNEDTRKFLIESESKPKSGNDVKNAKKASTKVKSTPKREEKPEKKELSVNEELSQAWDQLAAKA